MMNDLAVVKGSYILPVLFIFAVILIVRVQFLLFRAAVRANEQIALLQTMLREQKKQTSALEQLLDLSSGSVIEVLDRQPRINAAEDAPGYLKFIVER